MAVQALGYLGIGTQNIDEWSDFATRQLGCSWSTGPLPAAPSAWTIAASGSSLTGSVRTPNASLGGRSLTPQAWMPSRESSKRQVSPYDVNRRHSPISGLFATSFHFAIPTETGSRPFTGHRWPTRLLRRPQHLRLSTGAQGMGHVVLMVADFEAALAFYQDLLGFRISDFMRTPKICFLHVNARHHSLALFEHPRQGMHHLLIELYSLDDVGQGYDSRGRPTGSRCRWAGTTTTT